MKSIKKKSIYLLISIVTLSLGLTILFLLHDLPFIRGYVGDLLIVIFLYSTLKLLTNLNSTIVALAVIAFAFFIEFLQLINIVELLNIPSNIIINVILGSTFDIFDLLAYTIGVGIIFWLVQ